jgi:hypothetical protein
VTTHRLAYAHRHAGLDHRWYEHEPTHTRRPLVWPGGKPVALWITVPVEFFPLDASLQPVRPLGALDRGYPDFWSYSNRDYGTRVGICSPVLNWNVSNAVAVTDPAGNRKLDKDKATFRIDGAVTLAMCLGLRARDRGRVPMVDIQALIG